MQPTTAEVPPVRPTGGWLASNRLIRPAPDRKIAGVCAAIGRATGTDPLLWRVILAVLVVLSGAGLVLYAAGWLLFPSEGDESSAIESLFTPRKASMSKAGAAGLLLAAMGLTVITLITTAGRPFLVFAALALAIGGLARRRGAETFVDRTRVEPAAPTGTGDDDYRQPFARGGPYVTDRTRQLPAEPPPATAGTTRQLPGDPGDELAGYRFDPADSPVTGGPPEPPPAPPEPPRPSRPPRRRNRLGLITICLIVIAMSIMSIVAMAGAPIPASAFVAVALTICGLALISATWLGRSIPLYLLGFCLSVLMVVTMLAQGAGISGSGFKSYRPDSLDTIPTTVDVEMGAAEVHLDDLWLDEGTDITIDTVVVAGTISVYVDPEVDVVVNVTRARLGSVTLDGQETSGTGDGALVSDGGPGGGTLTITADVTMGEVEVLR